MTHIRVNPASMTAYGQQATGIFATIHGDLTNLVETVATVQYFGPNAVDFKTKCGALASEFAANLLRDIGTMADAVRASVSNIQGSLGGAHVQIEVTGSAISVPAVQTVDFVDVETSALEGLKPQVDAKFRALAGALDDHLARLMATDWEGNAKQQAVTTVTSFTNHAKDRCLSAQQSINQYIDTQLSSVLAADR